MIQMLENHMVIDEPNIQKVFKVKKTIRQEVWIYVKAFSIEEASDLLADDESDGEKILAETESIDWDTLTECG